MTSDELDALERSMRAAVERHDCRGLMILRERGPHEYHQSADGVPAVAYVDPRQVLWLINRVRELEAKKP